METILSENGMTPEEEEEILENCRDLFRQVESYSRINEEQKKIRRAELIAGGAVDNLVQLIESTDNNSIKISAIATISNLAFGMTDESHLNCFYKAGAIEAVMKTFASAETVELRTWCIFALCDMNANATFGLQHTWEAGAVAAVFVWWAFYLAAKDILMSSGLATREKIENYSVCPEYERFMECVAAENMQIPKDKNTAANPSPPPSYETSVMGSAMSLGPHRIAMNVTGLMVVFSRNETFMPLLRGLSLSDCPLYEQYLCNVFDEMLPIHNLEDASEEMTLFQSLEDTEYEPLTLNWFRKKILSHKLFAAEVTPLDLALDAVESRDEMYAHIAASVCAYMMGSTEFPALSPEEQALFEESLERRAENMTTGIAQAAVLTVEKKRRFSLNAITHHLPGFGTTESWHIKRTTRSAMKGFAKAIGHTFNFITKEHHDGKAAADTGESNRNGQTRVAIQPSSPRTGANGSPTVIIPTSLPSTPKQVLDALEAASECTDDEYTRSNSPLNNREDSKRPITQLSLYKMASLKMSRGLPPEVISMLLEGARAGLANQLYKGFSAYSKVWTFFQPLCVIAVADANKATVIDFGGVEAAIDALSHPDDKCKQFGAQLLWLLAFDPHGKERISGLVGAVEQLQSLAKTSTGQTRNNVMGALWQLKPKPVLDEVIPSTPKIKLSSRSSSGDKAPESLKRNFSADDVMSASIPEDSREDEEEVEVVADTITSELAGDVSASRARRPSLQRHREQHIMLSYQWADQPLVIAIKNELASAGFPIWIDVDCMANSLDSMVGSTLAAMADAVEHAAVVLMFVSRKYYESANCRAEAEYAFACRKPIVPVMTTSEYRPEGWLGILLGAKLWYDFSDCHPTKESGQEGVNGVGLSSLFFERMKSLLAEVNRRMPGESNEEPVRKLVSSVSTSQPSRARPMALPPTQFTSRSMYDPSFASGTESMFGAKAHNEVLQKGRSILLEGSGLFAESIDDEDGFSINHNKSFLSTGSSHHRRSRNSSGLHESSSFDIPETRRSEPPVSMKKTAQLLQSPPPPPPPSVPQSGANFSNWVEVEEPQEPITPRKAVGCAALLPEWVMSIASTLSPDNWSQQGRLVPRSIPPLSLAPPLLELPHDPTCPHPQCDSPRRLRHAPVYDVIQWALEVSDSDLVARQLEHHGIDGAALNELRKLLCTDEVAVLKLLKDDLGISSLGDRLRLVSGLRALICEDEEDDDGGWLKTS